jgi:hypothetical protein
MRHLYTITSVPQKQLKMFIFSRVRHILFFLRQVQASPRLMLQTKRSASGEVVAGSKSCLGCRKSAFCGGVGGLCLLKAGDRHRGIRLGCAGDALRSTSSEASSANPVARAAAVGWAILYGGHRSGFDHVRRPTADYHGCFPGIHQVKQGEGGKCEFKCFIFCNQQ